MSDSNRFDLHNLSDEELKGIIQQSERYDPVTISDAIEVYEARQFKNQRAQNNNKLSFKEIIERLFFSGQKRFFTPYIIIINVVLYIITAYLSQDLMNADTYQLYHLGGNINYYTLNGEWYRLIASTFLHGGLIHLGFNMFALFQLGILLEQFIGRKRFLTTYFVSGIGASLVSTYFNFGISIGASGAVFGLLGLLFILLVTKKLNHDYKGQKHILKQLIPIIIINLLIGFSMPNIDNAAHIGGFAIGFLTGCIYLIGLLKPQLKMATLLATVGLFSVLFVQGYQQIPIVANEYSELLSLPQKEFQVFTTNYDQINGWLSKHGERDGNMWIKDNDLTLNDVKVYKSYVSKMRQVLSLIPDDELKNYSHLEKTVKQFEEHAAALEYTFLPPASQ